MMSMCAAHSARADGGGGCERENTHTARAQRVRGRAHCLIAVYVNIHKPRATPRQKS
jgi:hypothetical protein